jgi:hypothetical protein
MAGMLRGAVGGGVVAAVGLLAGAASLVRRGLVSGTLAPDLGVGRRVRRLAPIEVTVRAPREVVFDVIAWPYLGRTPRAMAGSLQVIERGTDMVLAIHRTPLGGGRRATTVETVRFTRPSRVDFRVVRGPVPYVVEAFELTKDGDGTRLAYVGELGTDLGRLGEWWGDRVAPIWEAAVRRTFESVRTEAERRAGV